MAFPVRFGDLTIHGIGSEGYLGLRWHRLLFPAVGMPFVHYGVELGTPAAVHFGPVSGTNAALAPLNHSEPMLDAPIDSETPLPAGQDLGDLVTAFLPPDSDAVPDMPHGLDLGFSFTLPPLSPPLEFI